MADKDTGNPPGETGVVDITALNAKEAIELAHGLESVDAVRGFIDAERANSGFDGGRKTVLDALEERLGELETANGNAGSTEPDSPPADEPDSAAAEPPVVGIRQPIVGEKDWNARVGASLLNVEIVGVREVFVVRTLEGHPREVLIERADLSQRS